MKVLLAALSCLIAAIGKPLLRSRIFNTIYLTSNDLKEIGEDWKAGMLMDNVTLLENYQNMTVTTSFAHLNYYIR